jgi:hypothetical protein
LITFFILNPQIGPERLFSFIIITHYLNWYWHIYKKYKAINPAKIYPYIFECLSVNFAIAIVFIALIFVYRGESEALSSPIFTLLYTPGYFYVWTLMHLLVTWRREDYFFKLGYLKN